MAVTFFVPVRAFYCFDPADQVLCEALDRHLDPLKRKGRLQTWSERDLLAGQDRERERSLQFAAARLLMLLLSPDFLASAQGQQDIQMALDQQRAGKAVVLPLHLRSCLWNETELRSLHILPRGHQPLTLQSNPDAAWHEIASEISHLLDGIQQRVYLIAAPDDHKLVERLCQDLAHPGVSIWRQKDGYLSPGHTEECEAMRQSSSVLLVASPAAFGSSIVRTQRELAAIYKRPTQVVWVEGEEQEGIAAGIWQEETLLDARAERYEEAKELLLTRLAYPKGAVFSPPEEPPRLLREPRNPYKGLQSFTARDTSDFFGREALIDELVTVVEELVVREKKGQAEGRCLTVLGASGVGKSSMVLAGLLPRLQQRESCESLKWLFLDPIVPGPHPLEALALSLAQQSSLGNAAALHHELTTDSLRTLHLLASQLVSSSPRKVVIFIDQFEEVFTFTVSEKERQHFFDLLVTAASEPQGPLLVILALRADFSERAMQYPAFYRLLDTHRVSVLPMQRDELRQVIEKPAHLPDVQMTFEGDLVGDLLFEMHNQVGALPLLEFTLHQLFVHRDGQMFTLRAYHDIGGVKGALARHAEATYYALPTREHQALARSLFLRLIDPGYSQQDTIRRRASLLEFELPDPSQTQWLREVREAFLKARLLTSNEYAGVTTIEVSHEAVIREWARLDGWLRASREDVLLQQKISADVVEWQQRHRPHDRLYRGSQLKEARAWARRNTLSQQETTFLRMATRRRTQLVLSTLAVILLLMGTTGGSIWFYLQSQRAQAQIPNLVQVTTLNNDGIGSLRWAVDSAPAGKTITFASNLAGQTITLTDTLIFPAHRLSLQGPTPQRITVRNATHGIVIEKGAFITITNVIFLGSKSNSTSLLSNSGNLTLNNSIVSGNGGQPGLFGLLPSLGGGIDNDGSMTLNNSSISGNAASRGGGISNVGSVILNNSSVSSNTASGDRVTSSGGGIDNVAGGSMTLNNSTVSGNTTSGYGGGIDNEARGLFSEASGSMTLNNSTVSGNTARFGGGIDNEASGSMALNNSTVSGNTADYGGGIYNTPGGSMTLNNSTVSSNTATTYDGGGIGNFGSMTLSNSTISSNIATHDGGGIVNFGGTVIFVFCTLYGNKATNQGGGLSTEDNTGGSPPSPGHSTLSNSLVAGNQALADPDIAGNLTTGGYNLIENRAGIMFLDPDYKHGTDRTISLLSAIKIDPRLQLNGSTTTRTHALLYGSPAINVIPQADCFVMVGKTLITTDQRGIKRPQGSACDIGAFEYI